MTQTHLATTLTDLIGNTPLVPLGSLSTTELHVFAKLESYNVGGSLYDRLALSRLQRALQSGLVAPKNPLLDSSSSELSVSFAMLGAALGHPVHCVVERACNRTRLQLLQAYGATLHFVDHPVDRHKKARELQASDPRLFAVDGSTLPPEPSSSFAEELIADLSGPPDLLVLSSAFAELVTACTKQFARLHHTTQVLTVSLQGEIPTSDSYKSSTREHIEVPLAVSRERCRELLENESVLAGPETGAVLEAFHQVRHAYLPRQQRPLRAVLIAADHGDRFLSWVSPAFPERSVDLCR